MKQPEQSNPPPAHPGPSDAHDEELAQDERTSPTPYAENFAEWVGDETATPDLQRHPREPGNKQH